MNLFLQPCSRPFPGGLLDQPFYGWGLAGKNPRLARFCVLTGAALAFVVRNFFEAFNCRSLLVMFFLIANVFYHPFQILSAETNDAIAGLPIQDLTIHEFVIDVVRTGAFELSEPICD